MGNEMRHVIALEDRSAKLSQKGKPDFYPIAASVVFLILTAVLLVAVRYGVQNGDETFLLTETHRLMFGDRWLINIWSITQFFSVFLYIPVRLYLWLSGGTAGLLLFMRYAYVIIKLLFYIFLVVVLRRFRFWGLLFAVIFTTFHPIGFLTLSYYSVSVLGAATIGILFFVKRRLTAFDCIVAGVIAACSVIAEPPLTLLYLFYSFLVLIRRGREKRQKPFCDAHKDVHAKVCPTRFYVAHVGKGNIQFLSKFGLTQSSLFSCVPDSNADPFQITVHHGSSLHYFYY